MPAVFLALSGCIPGGSGPVWLPDDMPITRLGGCPTDFKAELFEQDGVALDFVVSPENVSPLQGSLHFNVPKGRTAKFLHSTVTVTGPSYSKPLTADLYGCPELYRSDHICFWDAPRISDGKLVVVTLPPVEIDGARYDLQPMRFLPRRKLVWCALSV
jgi:hypothetical protein